MQVCNANGQSRHHVNTMEMLGHGNDANAGTTLMNTSNGLWQCSCRLPSYTTVMSLTFLLQSHSDSVFTLYLQNDVDEENYLSNKCVHCVCQKLTAFNA